MYYKIESIPGRVYCGGCWHVEAVEAIDPADPEAILAVAKKLAYRALGGAWHALNPYTQDRYIAFAAELLRAASERG